MRALQDVRKFIGKAIGICVDRHVSDMRALRDVHKSVGKAVGDCGTIP